MTHQYSQPVEVHDADGTPTLIIWRSVRYRVRKVLATWHLRDRWWEQPEDATTAGASDRFYYRALCDDDFICDIYYDAASARWILDRVHD